MYLHFIKLKNTLHCEGDTDDDCREAKLLLEPQKPKGNVVVFYRHEAADVRHEGAQSGEAAATQERCAAADESGDRSWGARRCAGVEGPGHRCVGETSCPVTRAAVMVTQGQDSYLDDT